MTQANENIIKSLNWRYATKEFDTNKTINDADLQAILEGLRMTASSFGLQPWKFIVVRNKEIRERLVGSSWGQEQVSKASHLLVLARINTIDDKFVDDFISLTAAKRNVEVSSLKGFEGMLKGFLKGKNEEGIARWSSDQVYIALGNLLTVCAVLGIDACPMEGFKKSDYDEILGLDKLGLSSVLVCPIGYRDSNDKYADLEKIRYDLDSVTHYID